MTKQQKQLYDAYYLIKTKCLNSEAFNKNYEEVYAQMTGFDKLEMFKNFVIYHSYVNHLLGGILPNPLEEYEQDEKGQ